MLTPRVSAYLVLVGIFAASGGAASSAPAGLQYDEIARVVVGEATPPPPGGFKADLAAITNAAGEQTAAQPPKKHGFGNLLGAVLSGQSPVDAAAGDLTQDALANSMAGLLGSMSSFSAFMRQGKVAHYTFYNGWERVDDTAAQTATISKYDRHQIIYLNLQKHTYRTIDPTAPVSEVPSAPQKKSAPSSRQTEQPQEPGTAIVDLRRVGASLGPAVLDGVATTGFANTVTLSMSQATGSCRNGSFSMTDSHYFSSFAEPQLASGDRPALESRPAPRVPTDPRTMVDRGGCKPAFTTHSSGVAAPAGRFAMYSEIAMQPQKTSDAGTTPTSRFAFITERGNVQSMSSAAAAPLFEIPAGFTPE